MNCRGAAVLFVSLLWLLPGCEKARFGSADAPPAPELKTTEPAKTDPPRNDLGTVAASLLDGFEGPDHTVWAFDSADDEADAMYVSDGRTQGTRALKISLRQKGAKGKLSLRREVDLDLSDATALLLDLNAPSDKFSVALATKADPGDAYQESKPVNLKQGGNRVRFALDSKDWKNEKSKWQHDGPPVNLQGVTRLILLIFTGGEATGSFVLDNLQVEGIRADAALKKVPKTVYREWRPEILGLTPPPQAMNQYQTFEIEAVFSASYRDIFDPHDLVFGARAVTPAGKNLELRGFFGGLARAGKDTLKPGDHAAMKPLWGPPKKEKDKEKKDGEKKAADESDAPEEPLMPVWLLRFTPQETGRYTFQFFVRNAVGETRTVEHAVVVAPEAAATAAPGRKGGNVRVARSDPRQLELQNGSPFYIFGQNVCWTHDWDPYLRKIQAYGGNTCRIWLCPWGLQLERKTEPGAYDLQTAERIDQLLQRAEETGVRIIFCFSFHGLNQDFWHESAYNQANGGPCARKQDFFTDHRARTQFKRLLSYAISRWGASPALLSWELMNEMDLAAYDRAEDVAAWTREMAGHLKNNDAHNHLITTSSTNVAFIPEIWNDGRIDFVSVHGYGPDVAPLLYHYSAPYRALNKPHLLAEFGGGWLPADDIPDKDGARLQAALWLSACSSSCGAALPWWWDTYIETRELYPIFAAVQKFIAGDDRRGRFGEWVRKPYPSGVEVSGVMDNQGARLYVHHPGWTKTPESRGAALIADPVPLKLTGLLSGSYKLTFWDAREGTVFETRDASVTDGTLGFDLPKRAKEFAIKLDRKTVTRPGIE